MKKILIACLLLLFSPLVFAKTWTQFWHDLWATPNQQGASALAKGDDKRAAQLFKNKLWQGVAQYRSGHYAKAMQNFNQAKTPLAYYNQGNTLAHLGQYQKAIQAYDQALTQDPNFKDAAYNRAIIKKLLQRQQQKQNPQNKKNEQNNSNKSPQNSAAQRQSQNQQAKAQRQPQNSASNNNQTKNQRRAQNKNQAKPDKDQAKQPPSTSKQALAQTKPQTQKDQRSSDQRPLQTKNNNMHNPMSHAKQATQQSLSTQQKSASQKQIPHSIRTASQPQTLQQQAIKQWLQQIPDDPGGLLRQKFLRDHLRYETEKH